jgi:hypothetical protein
MISTLMKALIEKKLQIPYDQIIQKGSEQLDKHIEQNVIGQNLTISESSAGLVTKRGFILDLISIDKINIEIDNFVKAK